MAILLIKKRPLGLSMPQKSSIAFVSRLVASFLYVCTTYKQPTQIVEGPSSNLVHQYAWLLASEYHRPSLAYDFADNCVFDVDRWMLSHWRLMVFSNHHDTWLVKVLTSLFGSALQHFLISTTSIYPTSMN